MRIAYVNIDEVNQELAVRMAAKCGAIICGLAPWDSPPDGQFDAVLYNLDQLPRQRRAALLDELLRDSSRRPVAVHGFDLTEEQVEVLTRRGVTAARRLHIGLLRNLFRAARDSRAATVQEETRTDLTWVDLAR
jgi:hypothetical protein